MAKKKSSTQSLEAIGPSQSGEGGFGGGSDPMNPQDRLFSGALGTMVPPDLTQRRPFSMTTRNPLHYLEGPGTDEVVTVPQRKFPRDIDLMESAGQPGREGGPSGPNDPKTLNGAEIYGT